MVHISPLPDSPTHYEHHLGNVAYARRDFFTAITHYTRALDSLPLDSTNESLLPLTATLYCNRAAARLKLASISDADERPAHYTHVIQDATRALDLLDSHPTLSPPLCSLRVKALHRRKCAHLSLDHIRAAAQDAHTLATLRPEYTAEAGELASRADAHAEKQKTEALDQLKELGNSLLGHFGLSLDNFQPTRNPDGTYSIQYSSKPT
ncbi:hypothetical protein CDCA_CDCA16G4248 [Cyanidium caldarium]|uniref:TPR-like protein n=1 Tax=Cyanidium caldarium TaxID=2771 RepID=A0AAV9J1K7_CYACA|nr:hypothetical protein CDCA_CDCA16G4248 [Cyanidium caldarium]